MAVSLGTDNPGLLRLSLIGSIIRWVCTHSIKTNEVRGFSNLRHPATQTSSFSVPLHVRSIW